MPLYNEIFHNVQSINLEMSLPSFLIDYLLLLLLSIVEIIRRNLFIYISIYIFVQAR